ncbi:MAG: hypothetical protein HY791_19290 [Deltaproteobacteria bacterium]|nr:hypothetical protein [Deltaproteobacteria bacterium]
MMILLLGRSLDVPAKSPPGATWPRSARNTRMLTVKQHLGQKLRPESQRRPAAD